MLNANRILVLEFAKCIKRKCHSGQILRRKCEILSNCNHTIHIENSIKTKSTKYVCWKGARYVSELTAISINPSISVGKHLYCYYSACVIFIEQRKIKNIHRKMKNTHCVIRCQSQQFVMCIIRFQVNGRYFCFHWFTLAHNLDQKISASDQENSCLLPHMLAFMLIFCSFISEIFIQ